MSTPPTASERPYDPPLEPEPRAARSRTAPRSDGLPADPPGAGLARLARRIWAPLALVGLLLWNVKFGFFAVFKFKLHRRRLDASSPIGGYALLWGWQFAVGFVLLLFVHELGHVLEAKRQGLPVAPRLHPVPRRVTCSMENPRFDAWREAKLAIAGPIARLARRARGLRGSARRRLALPLIALAFTGFFLNLFNLLPIVPLDGGRIVAAITRCLRHSAAGLPA